MAAGDGFGVGVVGLGFMGTTHVRAYQSAAAAGHACQLVAVCDADADRRAGKPAGGNIGEASEELLFDPSEVSGYEKLEDLLADERVELVSICTPTDTHVELAKRALAAGKHVLVEKPVAVSTARVQELVDAAEASGKLCMPAMCIRHWPAYAWVKQATDEGRFGAVRSATFHRLASPPAWSTSFYTDPERTGGALTDLHIHDADFVYHLLGTPDRVFATGSLDHVTASYLYTDGPGHVVAEGGWDHADGFAFRMRFVVVFENATVEFDGETLLVSQDGRSEAVEVSSETGWEMQVRALVDAVNAGGGAPTTMADALAVAKLLDAERESLKTGGATLVSPGR